MNKSNQKELNQVMDEFILDKEIHFLQNENRKEFKALTPTSAIIQINKTLPRRLKIDSISSPNLLKKS